MLLKLTRPSGQPVVVNSDQIVLIRPTMPSGSVIETTGADTSGKARTLAVTESMDQIMTMTARP